MKKTGPAILVIGLDAATMDLIGPWAEAGHLHAVRSLMETGSSSVMLSTANMHSASAWTSILTGLNPGRHGLFVFSDRDFATGRQVFFKGSDRTGELITSHLARQGMSAGLLNVPMTYPAPSVPGGFAVSGLDSPSLDEKAFAPAGLREELMRRFPRYRFSPPDLGSLMSSGRVEKAVQEWLDLVEVQTDAAEFLLESRPVDFFMTVYTASDWAGHNLWGYLERASETEGGLSGAMLRIYKALDRAIGRLKSLAADDAQIYIISDHGMGPHTGASYKLAEWLEEKGYMRRRRVSEGRKSLLVAARGLARKVLPESIKERIREGIGTEGMNRIQAVEKDSFYSSIDWAGTVAYTEPGRHVININLAGRNFAGTVDPGDYDGLIARITEDLAGWKDSRGIPAVERAVPRSESYSGPFTVRASDLYVYWNTQARFEDLPDEVRSRGFWWSGDHRPEGIMICSGAGIRQNASLAGLKVYDVVPTVLYGRGLAVPSGLDGRVIEEAFSDEFRAARPVRYESLESDPRSDSGGLSASEEELIEEKLRGLGYL